jgi:hypothetical protein
MIAAQGGQSGIVMQLLKIAPHLDINTRNNLGFTALMRACDQVCGVIDGDGDGCSCDAVTRVLCFCVASRTTRPRPTFSSTPAPTWRLWICLVRAP